ncbi:unnamed protein product [Euphydryas editha]|uniref:Uncharacterized protein n=1 Tax=Euphydryas editha TaxID=104508 RepID=A0AAU9UUH4_EUPED|nr:unnamed protein product [Euphydryas editha]
MFLIATRHETAHGHAMRDLHRCREACSAFEGGRDYYPPETKESERSVSPISKGNMDVELDRLRVRRTTLEPDSVPGWVLTWPWNALRGRLRALFVMCLSTEQFPKS